jgi:hypothetical protein
MDGSYTICEGDEKCITEFYLEMPEGRDHLGGQRINESIILKCTS